MSPQNEAQIPGTTHYKNCQRTTKRDGFSIIDSVLGEAEVLWALEQLDRADLKRSRAGARHILGHPVVSALANDARLLGLAQLSLGESAFPFRATLFDKSPSSNWLVVWHQDTALPLRQKIETEGWGPWSLKENVFYAHAPARALEQIVALRIHIHDSNESNGPLRVLPGTHTRGVLTDPEIQELASSIEPVDCTVPKGGVVVLRPLAVHASSKLRSNHFRRVLHIEYSAARMIDAQLEIATA
jgi:ectoine hydroxylase-related dioxygenase (phytanoyl-CoA dioxygenase family)